MTGYTAPGDGKPLDPEFARLFPPGTAAGQMAPGGQEQPGGTLVEPAPSKPGAKRPAARPAAKPKKRAKPKARKSTPGAVAHPKTTPVYDPPSKSGKRPAPKKAK